MAGEGTVLYRDKTRPAAWFHWLLGGMTVAGGASALFIPGLVPALVAGASFVLPMALLWILFSVLRVTVSEGAVNIQYGLFGPKIPIAAIEQAEYFEYDFKRYGGWGIRLGPGGEWMYNMPGDQGRAVRIRWKDKKGRERITCVGTPTARELAGAIGKTGVKVLDASGDEPKALGPAE